MGRARKGLIKQSQKKPKNPMKMNKEVNYWWKLYEDSDKKYSVFLSKDCLEALKRMEPKEVADILFK